MKKNRHTIRHLSEFSGTEYAEGYSMLSLQRRRDIAALTDEKDRQRSVFAELLARRMLAEKMGKAPHKLEIFYEDMGKPLVDGAWFSVSHSGNYVACAVDDVPVGIDIETIREIDQRLVKVCCTDAEKQRLERLSPHLRSRQLLRLWILKESTIKCLGQYLNCVKDYEFSILPGGLVIGSDTSLQHTLISPNDGFVAAVCRQESPTAIPRIRQEQKSLRGAF